MSLCAVLLFLCVLGVFDKGLAAVIETQQTVMAAVGEEALLTCQLMEHKDVLLVTWQKVLPEGEKNVASYNEYLGPKVNPAFRDKVEFKDAGLQKSSIVIRRVTEEDEGCYHCVFNTYPDGALTATTCLQPYELHEPVLHVRESKSPADDVILITVLVVVSCVCVAAVIIIVSERQHGDRLSHTDSEEIRTPQKTTTDPHQPKTPLLSQENEVQQRMSSGKKKENGSPTESSVTAECRRQLCFDQSELVSDTQ